MDNDCCRKSYHWEGTLSGKEDKLGDRPAYITGTSTSSAVLFLHDGFGWKWPNARLLADYFAKEADATVYIPDFFDGFEMSSDPEHQPVDIVRTETGGVKFEFSKDFDWKGWSAKNGVQVRTPDILACARILRRQYAKLGAVGYCWGGQAGFVVAQKDLDVKFDAVSIVHPGTPTEEQIRGIGVAVQILAPEHDPTFTQELRELSNVEIPKVGVDYCFHYFPDMIHGFASKCDLNVEKERKAMETAKMAVAFWFKTHL